MNLSNTLDAVQYLPRVVWKRGAMPVYLIHFVTEVCNARCKHCFNRCETGESSSRAQDLSLEEIETLTKSLGRLLFYLPTGGEPFLREDLPEIVSLFYRNCHVRNVGIPTNGSLTTQVLSSASRMLQLCPDLRLGIDISLDGIGKDHDDIRGVPGLFDKAIATYQELNALSAKTPRFKVCVEVTFQKDNQDKMRGIYSYFVDHLKTYNIIVRYIRGTPRDPSASEVDPDKFEAFANLLEHGLKTRAYQGHSVYPLSRLITARDLLGRRIQLDVIRRKTLQVPCYAGSLIGVLRSQGDVQPCELSDFRAGNVRETDFRSIWHGEAMKRFRENIVKRQCFCTHECYLTVNLLFTARMYPSLLKELLKLYA